METKATSFVNEQLDIVQDRGDPLDFIDEERNEKREGSSRSWVQEKKQSPLCPQRSEPIAGYRPGTIGCAVYSGLSMEHTSPAPFSGIPDNGTRASGPGRW